ncbi:hypothetical protein AAG612_09955 [Citromicrobium bathyomarinum]|uniref:hypothetical protein n=1 Tax=Citromicrobium bathyomarinum TaxID=72174 RepID=UPI003159E2B6
MNLSPIRHPGVLATLEIVRDRAEPRYRSPIRSIAIFTIIKCPEWGVRFVSEHYAFKRETSRSDIIEGIAKSIPADATLICKALPGSFHMPREVSVAMPFSPSDLQLIERQRVDLDVVPVTFREAILDETATTYAIERADPASSPLAQARRAADETQVLWLTFLTTCCRDNDRTSLGSAFQAWRAIDQARPLPF